LTCWMHEEGREVKTSVKGEGVWGGPVFRASEEGKEGGFSRQTSRGSLHLAVFTRGGLARHTSTARLSLAL